MESTAYRKAKKKKKTKKMYEVLSCVINIRTHVPPHNSVVRINYIVSISAGHRFPRNDNAADTPGPAGESVRESEAGTERAVTSRAICATAPMWRHCETLSRIAGDVTIVM